MTKNHAKGYKRIKKFSTAAFTSPSISVPGKYCLEIIDQTLSISLSDLVILKKIKKESTALIVKLNLSQQDFSLRHRTGFKMTFAVTYCLSFSNPLEIEFPYQASDCNFRL
jgi:hypothetical protein